MASTQKAKIPVGFVIAGKYRVTGELGRGGMAAVYEAENVDIGKRVAIKVLAPELTSSTVVVERFLREARAAAAIRSPYICDVYDSGRLEDGRPFLVLELLEGESLYERMVQVGQIDVETTVNAMTQTCRGLTKAHAAGIVHRDLKPENIFLTKDEEGRLLVKILDFGLAKFYQPVENGEEQARLTREGAVFGTPAYMSPEQVRGQGAADARADLWAIGCITYECLTGRTVWSTEQGVAMTFAQIAANNLPDPLQYRPGLPAGFRTWFHKALHKDIAQRFQTPKELSDGLVAVFEMQPSSVRASEGSTTEILLLPRATPSTPASVPGAATATTSAGEPAPAPQKAEPDASSRSSRAAFAAGGDKAAPNRPESSSPGRALLGLAVAALLAGGGYFGWRKLNPPSAAPVSSAALDTSASAASSTSASPVAQTSASTLDHGAGLPFRPLIAKAQEAIASGDLEAARARVKEAVDLGAHHVPQTFAQHLDAISGLKQEPLCRLTGLARPRSYDLLEEKVKVVAAGRPSIAVGPKGAVMVWTEVADGLEHAYAVALDDALRAKSQPFAITPEGQSIQKPEILVAGERFLLTYWDTRGPEAGVYARYLDADGRIASSATLIAQAVGGASAPTATTLPDGKLLFSWVAPTDKNTEDLWLRRFSPTFEPAGEPVRATVLRPSPLGRVRVRFPVAGSDGEAVHFAYRLERDPERTIVHQRVAFADLGNALGTDALTAQSPDQALGTLTPINTDKSRADWPGLACTGDQCFVTWNVEGRDGVWVAYHTKGDPKPVWKREVVKNGGRHPAVAVNGSGQAQLVWFERGKVMTSLLDRDGVREPSPVARVSSTEQPQPSLVAGTKPGEWYTAWLDYEGGHLEAYAARVSCK